jgi:deoxyribodipyrimidine photo-lyase
MEAMDAMERRIRQVNAAPIRPGRGYVLYWMIASRRTRLNYALDRALAHARELRRPLVIFEPLRCGYPWASDRLHAFVLQGMRDNARALAGTRALYYPFVERTADEGKGLLKRLADDAAVVVTDDFPAFFLPRMIAAAGRALDVSLEAVDGNGLLPLAATGRVFTTAASFRRFLHKTLPDLFQEAAFPSEDPFASGARLARKPDLPDAVLKKWPAASDLLDAAKDPKHLKDALANLPIDHGVGLVTTRGGQSAGGRVLAAFLDERLERYVDERNEPDPERDASSGLSPYLHFGHISVHEVFSTLMTREGWTTRRIRPKAAGRREGWWGASAAAESFLDELITWREIGINMCHLRGDYDRYESLPPWARETLEAHARDLREHRYSLEQFESGGTHDPLWNAAQHQLVREGRMHNYLRMLWGKKILEWSSSPRAALKTMIHLNNRYALDGRDPNSYSGIFWTLGRYDRAWGPEREIFGKIRYMSSENTARKLRVKDYIAKYA